MDVDDSADLKLTTAVHTGFTSEADEVRRRYLSSLIQSTKRGPTVSSSPPSHRREPHASRYKYITRIPLPIVPGYTILVDTNILLPSLSMLALVLESLPWTVVILVQVPVILELNSLSSDSSPGG
jgi:hypothetical protein